MRQPLRTSGEPAESVARPPRPPGPDRSALRMAALVGAIVLLSLLLMLSG